ncbi:hypothetical protein AGMMS50267_05560 [Spirochaetia bacterium]|nr:hypothetical protein AGMMS50267_05560 [Spirochaetia bacterium]
MGRIKSALEIALERTESVKGDKTSIDQFEAKQKGKRLANEFLDGQEAGPQTALEQELKKIPKEQQASFTQGVFDVLISQLILPVSKEDEKRLAAAGKGLRVIIADSRFAALFTQLTQVLSRYLEEAAQYEEAIQRQYAPKLRQKEEELSRRMGRPVQLDPFQDPEFIAFFNQNMNGLRANYQALVDQAREQTVQMFALK